MELNLSVPQKRAEKTLFCRACAFIWRVFQQKKPPPIHRHPISPRLVRYSISMPLAVTSRACYKNSMSPELSWAGLPIGEGEGYGGGRKGIPKTWSQNPALAAAKQQHYAVITEEDLAEVFGNGAYTLTGAEAAKLLELRTRHTQDKLLSRSTTERPLCQAFPCQG
jgi:hypothetical protein